VSDYPWTRLVFVVDYLRWLVTQGSDWNRRVSDFQATIRSVEQQWQKDLQLLSGRSRLACSL
jgi:hypothetical protein